MFESRALDSVSFGMNFFEFINPLIALVLDSKKPAVGIGKACTTVVETRKRKKLAVKKFKKFIELVE
jgi:hypothetical protein